MMMMKAAVLLVALMASSVKVNAISLTDANFDAEVFDSGKSAFVKFQAPWCGHCKNMKPDWDKLMKEFADNKDVIVGDVDCTIHQDLCAKQGVKGYPDIKFWHKKDIKQGNKKANDYSGGRDYNAWKKFVKDNLETPVGVVDLTASNFKKEVLESGKSAFVKFYAPWCGHCKRMKPAWGDLGEEFAGNKAVIVGDVDCTVERDLCSTYGVRGFPTLKWFNKGEPEQEPYRGGRDLAALKKYVSENIGQQKEELRSAY